MLRKAGCNRCSPMPRVGGPCAGEVDPSEPTGQVLSIDSLRARAQDRVQNQQSKSKAVSADRCDTRRAVIALKVIGEFCRAPRATTAIMNQCRTFLSPETMVHYPTEYRNGVMGLAN